MEDKKNKNDKIYLDYKFKKVAIIIQLVLVILAIVFLILSISKPIFKDLSSIVLGLALLVMSYNNYKVFKRKSFTLIYLIVGALVLIFGIIGLLK